MDSCGDSPIARSLRSRRKATPAAMSSASCGDKANPERRYGASTPSITGRARRAMTSAMASSRAESSRAWITGRSTASWSCPMGSIAAGREYGSATYSHTIEQKEGNRSPRLVRILEAALGLLIAAECAANALWRGIVFSPDSRFFIKVADAMLLHQWSSVPNKLPVIVYTVLPLLIVAAKMIAPLKWPLLIVLVNALATACAGVLAFRLAGRHIGALGGAIVAAGFLLGSDIVDWSRYILTDSLYLGMAMLAIYLMIEAVVRQAPRA